MTADSEWPAAETSEPASEFPDYSGKMTDDPDMDPGYAGAEARGRHSVDAAFDGQSADGAGPGYPFEYGEEAPADLAETADAAGESISMAAFTAFVQQMDARFGAVHEALTATVTGLEQNLEQSLAELRAREAAARGEVSRDLLRPLAQRFAMLVDRIELAIDRREEDPCDPWLLSQTAVDEALEILEEFGIDDIDAEPGSEVDRSRHRVVKMGNEKGEATDTSRIVERRRRGLMVDGYVVRPAEVVAEWVSADSGDED